MSTRFTPYRSGESPSNPTDSDGYIPVRIAEPRSDGPMLVYLPGGTAFVVNSHHVVRFDRDRNDSVKQPG
jgi:hypothetical protein